MLDEEDAFRLERVPEGDHLVPLGRVAAAITRQAPGSEEAGGHVDSPDGTGVLRA